MNIYCGCVIWILTQLKHLREAAGTKWAEGQKVWDGEVGYWVTSYFWIKGSDIFPYFVVVQAQRKAVTAKYGSVNNKTSYKMKTK